MNRVCIGDAFVVRQANGGEDLCVLLVVVLLACEHEHRILSRTAALAAPVLFWCAKTFLKGHELVLVVLILRYTVQLVHAVLVAHLNALQFLNALRNHLGLTKWLLHRHRSVGLLVHVVLLKEVQQESLEGREVVALALTRCRGVLALGQVRVRGLQSLVGRAVDHGLIHVRELVLAHDRLKGVRGQASLGHDLVGFVHDLLVVHWALVQQRVVLVNIVAAVQG